MSRLTNPVVTLDFYQITNRDSTLHVNPFNRSAANTEHEGSFGSYGYG